MSKAALITTLRDKDTGLVAFRAAAEQLAALLAAEVAELLPTTACEVETPLSKTQGYRYQRDLIIAPILRAGVAFPPSLPCALSKSENRHDWGAKG